MKVLSCDQMRMLEKTAVENGASYRSFMEQAGNRAAQEILKKLPAPEKTVVLCGKGNNGGDGFVIARVLQQHGAQVVVVLLEGAPATEDATAMFSMIQCSVPVLSYNDPQVCTLIQQANTIVDAVYGIGFRGSVKEQLMPIFQEVNRSEGIVFAIDLPSGAQGDSGAVEGVCIDADITISFTTLKPAHVLYPSADYCGQTLVVPVGISDALVEQSPCLMEAVDLPWVKKRLPVRRSSAHKGTFGTLLAVCGSRGMAGAAVLSANAALHSGAGLVKMAVPEGIYPIIASHLVEPVFLLLNENNKGTLSRQGNARLVTEVKKASACLIGCGMGCNEDTRLLVEKMIQGAETPVIIDADGINALCENIDRIKTARAPLILTPHPGEMARLLGTSIENVQKNRYHIAQGFAQENGVVLVLKGAHTLVALPDGRVYVNRTGNPGMARGGSGDVLAGIVAAFAAQGMTPADAAVCGVYLHGLAGDRCADKYSQMGMTPTNLIGELPGLFLEIGR